MLTPFKELHGFLQFIKRWVLPYVASCILDIFMNLIQPFLKILSMLATSLTPWKLLFIPT